MSQPKPFIICKAAAGSGKTFTLVREYLRLAIASIGDRGEQYADGLPRGFRSILAITFTNKAANEMKSRIMKTLGQIADHGLDPAGSPMGRSLLDALNAMPRFATRPYDEAALRRDAALLRSAILHHYSDLSVSTIDSFMHRIVRTFAHDLDQPVGFEVMIEKKDLIEQAVSNLISLVGTEGHDDLTRAVADFAISRMENEQGFDLRRPLTELSDQLFSEGADRSIELLKQHTLSEFMDAYRRYADENRALEQQLRALGSEALRLLGEAGMDESVCSGGSTGYLGYFAKLAAGTMTMPGKNTVKVFDSPDYGAATLCKAKAYTPAAENVAPRLREIYLAIAPMLTDYNTRQVLLANLYANALLGELDRCLHEYTRANEVVHLSDFNRLINNIVREEYAPFIYERLGNRYRHFLIDEFQDTSVLQWQNLVPLLDNGVAQGHDSLVVGDGKQAIYRFRQGDVRQFVALPRVEGMGFHGQALANAQVLNLDHNHRTAKAVVDFNNEFFSWVVRNRFADCDLARKIYIGGNPENPEKKEELRQIAVKDKPGYPEGYVDVSFLDGDADDAIPARVHEIIRQLVDEQGYRYRDILVLGRSKSDLAKIGSYLLNDSTIEQSSAESFYLTGSLAVKALVAALRCLVDPADRIAATALLAHLAALGIIAPPEPDIFLDAKSFDLVDVLAAQGIAFSADSLLGLDLYNCCEDLVRVLRLDGIDVPYVASFLNRVAAFSARHRQSLPDFLGWFDDHPKLSAAVSEEGDAIRLMTIHAAKGLEAPVVICPFFKPSPHPVSLWVDVGQRWPEVGQALPAAYITAKKDLATRFDPDFGKERESSRVDDLNILYVALTRPRERLYVVCPEPSGESQDYARLLADYFADLKLPTSQGDPNSPRPVADAADGPGAAWVSRIDFGGWTDKVFVASPSAGAVTPLLDPKVRFGIYAHELLADIRHSADVDDALARFVSRQSAGAVDEGELAQLEALARDVVANPLTAHFFDPAFDVKNECDLTDGSAIGRPDRIVCAPDQTWVVDFKTGRDLGFEHDKQVGFYCRTLADMGFPQVSGWLLYLQPSLTLRPVPLA